MSAVAIAPWLCAFGLGCGGGRVKPPEDMAVLEPLAETTEMKPGVDGTVGFRLRRGDQVIPGVRVDFLIFDDPATDEDNANGATLAASSAVTDAAGEAKVTLHAGLEAIVPLRAGATEVSAYAQTTVFVGNGEYGAIELAPLVVASPGTLRPPDVMDVVLLFFDGMSCSDIELARPPVAVRPPKVTAPDAVARFTSVNTSRTHAAVGQGRDAAGRIRAAGCVDIPGLTLQVQGVVRLTLPMAALFPITLGTFAVSTHFEFPTPPSYLLDVSAGFREITNCMFDPAQLWIDCTIDAITPDDALDCVPANEGRLGLALSAHRGLLVPGSACRAQNDPAGPLGLEAKAMAMFGDDKPLRALREAAAEAERLFETIDVHSLLTFTATTQPEVRQTDHVFTDVVFGGPDKSPAKVTLASLGIPQLDARSVSVLDSHGQLSFPAHGITLRLGTVARVAFGAQSLAPRGLPTQSTAIVEQLTNLAVRLGDDGALLVGCAALDHLLCGDSGEPQGCVRGACNLGLGAMARVLDAGFAKLDGDGVDFVLSGNAEAIDRDGDGHAETIGNEFSEPKKPGIWTASIRPRPPEPAHSLLGSFTASKL